MPRDRHCRGCGALLTRTFVDLGASPPSNAYLDEAHVDSMEATYPLHVFVCTACFLVQLPQYTAADELFSPNYAYFSSFSDTWLAHSRAHAQRCIERLELTGRSRVVEVASNDGYLLQYFLASGIPSRGIEPTHEAAQAARERGVPTDEFFLGEKTARRFVDEHGAADLVVANNVLAHVPDLHDFVAGLEILVASRGVITIEFPHIMELIEHTQFDTIYHEHFSYFSLLALEPVLEKHGLELFDVDALSTHGGSLRLWAGKRGAHDVTDAVRRMRAAEREAGLASLHTYDSFGNSVRRVKRAFLHFLLQAADDGKTVAAYGAAAKGNTLLNYCGVRDDLVQFVVDRNPHKAGKRMPGSRIPILTPDVLLERRPDYVLILPWNIKDEVMEQMHAVIAYGGRFVVAVPELTVFE